MLCSERQRLAPFENVQPPKSPNIAKYIKWRRRRTESVVYEIDGKRRLESPLPFFVE